MPKIVKFEVTGTAQKKTVYLDDDKIKLDHEGKGKSKPKASGKALLSYGASGPTGATLKISMTNTKPKTVSKKVPATGTVIEGDRDIEIL